MLIQRYLFRNDKKYPIICIYTNFSKTKIILDNFDSFNKQRKKMKLPLIEKNVIYIQGYSVNEEIKIPGVIYDLIQAGLVEKVE